MPKGISFATLKEKIAKKRGYINTTSTLMQLRSFAIPASYRKILIHCLRRKFLKNRGESKDILDGYARPVTGG
jgi:hypothetical protein